MSDLHARVTAANRVFKRANELHAVLTEIFRPYVGKQVLKADGSLLAKIREQIPNLDSDKVSVVRDSNSYSLRWECKSSENVACETYCRYFRASFTVGHFGSRHDGTAHTLTELVGPPQYREDWTAEEIVAAREEAKRLQRLADDAKSKYHLFGEYDNQ